MEDYDHVRFEGDTGVVVNDDRPFNEYYLLRRARQGSDR